MPNGRRQASSYVMQLTGGGTGHCTLPGQSEPRSFPATPAARFLLQSKHRNSRLFQCRESLFTSPPSLFYSSVRGFHFGGSMPSVPVESFLLGGESFLLVGRAQTLNGKPFLLNAHRGKGTR